MRPKNFRQKSRSWSHRKRPLMTPQAVSAWTKTALHATARLSSRISRPPHVQTATSGVRTSFLTLIDRTAYLTSVVRCSAVLDYVLHPLHSHGAHVHGLQPQGLPASACGRVAPGVAAALCAQLARRGSPEGGAQVLLLWRELCHPRVMLSRAEGLSVALLTDLVLCIICFILCYQKRITSRMFSSCDTEGTATLSLY